MFFDFFFVGRRLGGIFDYDLVFFWCYVRMYVESVGLSYLLLFE